MRTLVTAFAACLLLGPQARAADVSRPPLQELREAFVTGRSLDLEAPPDEETAKLAEEVRAIQRGGEPLERIQAAAAALQKAAGTPSMPPEPVIAMYLSRQTAGQGTAARPTSAAELEAMERSRARAEKVMNRDVFGPARVLEDGIPQTAAGPTASREGVPPAPDYRPAAQLPLSLRGSARPRDVPALTAARAPEPDKPGAIRRLLDKGHEFYELDNIAADGELKAYREKRIKACSLSSNGSCIKNTLDIGATYVRKGINAVGLEFTGEHPLKAVGKFAYESSGIGGLQTSAADFAVNPGWMAAGFMATDAVPGVGAVSKRVRAMRAAAKAADKVAHAERLNEVAHLGEAARRQALGSERLLGGKLSLKEDQIEAVMRAHNDVPCAVGTCTTEQLLAKARIMDEAGIPQEARRELIQKGFAGNAPSGAVEQLDPKRWAEIVDSAPNEGSRAVLKTMTSEWKRPHVEVKLADGRKVEGTFEGISEGKMVFSSGGKRVELDMAEDIAEVTRTVDAGVGNGSLKAERVSLYGAAKAVKEPFQDMGSLKGKTVEIDYHDIEDGIKMSGVKEVGRVENVTDKFIEIVTADGKKRKIQKEFHAVDQVVERPQHFNSNGSVSSIGQINDHVPLGTAVEVQVLKSNTPLKGFFQGIRHDEAGAYALIEMRNAAGEIDYRIVRDIHSVATQGMKEGKELSSAVRYVSPEYARYTGQAAP